MTQTSRDPRVPRDEIFDFYEGMSQELFGRPIKHVLLCHDNELNADHFSEVAARIRGRGYTSIPLDEALRDPAYTHEDTYVGGWGKSWLQRWWLSEGRPKRFQDEPDPPEWLETLRVRQGDWESGVRSRAAGGGLCHAEHVGGRRQIVHHDRRGRRKDGHEVRGCLRVVRAAALAQRPNPVGTDWHADHDLSSSAYWMACFKDIARPSVNAA